jgi:HD-like signal output (HDOD) protein/CheY-like chemotaxis protein
MSRILFVDDEPRVLDGLRRTWHFAGPGWDVDFVHSGPEALTRAAASPFDAVVTDVRMPGMDGSELLEHVGRRFPATARFILSGQCLRETAFRAVGVAHQFFTKPCDSESLRAAVVRACGAMERLPDAGHRALVAGVRCVPSSPSAYRALVTELESGQPSAHRLGRIIARDVGMAAKLLQLVSSGFFGSPPRSGDPARWAAFLGVETLRLLVAAATEMQQSERCFPTGCSLGALGLHSCRVADGARAIAACESADPDVIRNAYLAGLLHDVGLFVLAARLPHCYAAARARSLAQRSSIWEVERAVLDTTHAEVGASLLALWGSPPAIVEAVEFHHRPSLSDSQSFSPLAAVHVANAVAIADARDLPIDERRVDAEYLARIGCASRLGRWRELCCGARETNQAETNHGGRENTEKSLEGCEG